MLTVLCSGGSFYGTSSINNNYMLPKWHEEFLKKDTSSLIANETIKLRAIITDQEYWSVGMNLVWILW